MRGQLAPPSASTTALADTAIAPPSASVKVSAPSSAQPVQRCRACSVTPSPASRRSHARTSVDAFMPVGNTRPLEPTKVSTPSPAAQPRRSSGVKPARHPAKNSRRSP